MTRIGSLCSGYGGLELGLMDVVGGSVAWHVEYDKHPSAVLDTRFPGVPNYGDITTTDWREVEPVDWLTAGYPCQPFSSAGRRQGSNDERHLWPAVADAIGALRPRRVLLENVVGHLTLGMDAVLGDLAALGYDAVWGVVRAANAGAPHRRERVFIVAAALSDGAARRWDQQVSGRGSLQGAEVDGEPAQQPRRLYRGDQDAGALAIADADGLGLQGVGGLVAVGCDADGCGSADVAWGVYEPAIRRWERVVGRPGPRPTEPGPRGGERLSPRFVEWMMGLPAGWVTDVGLPRNAQLKALGNGVVPQQAALAVRTLLSVEAAAA